jgi:hypothetical protein
MTTFIMPLTNVPQQFEIALAGINYLLTCKWNDAPEGGWVLDFADSETNLAIVANIPLITGADLLSGLEYLGFNGSLIVFTDGDDFATPTLLNLGVESNLYFQTEVVA